MDKTIILFAGIVLIIIASLVVGSLNFTGNSVLDQYTYTKAICNSGNECIDVLIKCGNGEVESIEPTSDLIKFDESWEDFRENSKLC